MDQKTLNRFWSKVNKYGKTMNHMETPCWEWTASLRSGYGQFTYPQKQMFAHRFSWLVHCGEIPEGDHYGTTCVLHKCDNRKCVNPEHLFLGSNVDNIADKMSKGRHVVCVGEQCYNSKLSDSQVLEIREKYVPRKYTLLQIANDYDVDQSTIRAIIKRKAWRHI